MEWIYIKLLISILLVVCSVTITVVQSQRQDDPFLTHDEPGGVPFRIQVLLIGFQGDGAYSYRLDHTHLETLLSDSYPKHRPHSIHSSIYQKMMSEPVRFQSKLESHLNNGDGDDTEDEDNNMHYQEEDPQPLLSHFDIEYTVKQLPSSTLERLEHVLITNMQLINQNISIENEQYHIPIEPLEKFFDYEIKVTTTSSMVPIYSIVFINPNKQRLFKDPNYASIHYQYTMDGNVCSPAWIGAGRYIVVDLSAGPLKWGSTLHKSTEEKISEGSVNQDSLPRLVEFFHKDGYIGTSLQGASQIEIEAHISSLVISSLQHVFLSDTNYDFIPLFPKILIPILIFRDHNEFDPMDPRSTDSQEYILDHSIVYREAQRLFPFSEVKVITGSHSIHEHKHISMALSKSIKYHTSFELNPKTNTFESVTRPYIDSKGLLLKLKREDDLLASGLFEDMLLSDKPTIGGGKNSGRSLDRTKILPVYVFSLINTDRNMLLDKYYLYDGDQEAITVLQSPYSWNGIHYKGNKVIGIQSQSITRNIIAGLATSQGLLGPTLRYSQPHHKLKNNYLWSFGHHPFGFFNNGSVGISQIFIDIASRNTIITSIQSSSQMLHNALRSIYEFSTLYLMDEMGLSIEKDYSDHHQQQQDQDKEAEEEKSNGNYGGYLIDRFYHASANTKLPFVKSTIAKLHDEYDSIQERMTEAIQLLDTLTTSDMTLKKSQKDNVSMKLVLLHSQVYAYADYVSEELTKAKIHLQCCQVTSVSKTKVSKSNTTAFLSIIGAAGLFFIILILTNRKKNTLLKKRI